MSEYWPGQEPEIGEDEAPAEEEEPEAAAIAEAPPAGHAPGDLDIPDDVSVLAGAPRGRDRKSTRLNSSHIQKSRMPSSA